MPIIITPRIIVSIFIIFTRIDVDGETEPLRVGIKTWLTEPSWNLNQGSLALTITESGRSGRILGQ